MTDHFFGKMESMIYYILANPHAGHGRGKQVTDTLIAHLQAQEIAYRLFETQQPLDEKALVAEILQQKSPEDRLLIIGGDGTISLSIKELPAREVFSYIPAGSGNDLARGLGIALNDAVTTFDKLHKAEPSDIFVIKYESETLSGFATNNIGIGLDAAIVDATNKSKLKAFLNTIKLGQLSYLISALHVVFTKKSFSITANQVQFDKALLFTVTNHPYFGGGVPLAPEAEITAPDLHLVEVDKFNLLGIFRLIPKLLKAQHFANQHVHHLVAKDFTLISKQKEVVQIDGEICYIQADQPLKVTTEKRTILK
jgi:YegS/Rv2252/BmrU family lipid kinase